MSPTPTSIRSHPALWVPVALLLSASPSPAADFIVDTQADVRDLIPGNGICGNLAFQCSLRAAIEEANALAGDDRIFLSTGTYTLALAGSGEDSSATGDLDVLGAAGSLEILGASRDATRIDGNGLDRVLEVHSGGNLLLDSLTVTGGASGASPGGGVRNHGTLELENVRIEGNQSATFGGALHNRAQLLMRRTEVTGNVSTKSAVSSGSTSGSGPFVTATILDSTIWGNTATISGAVSQLELSNAVTLFLENVTVSGAPSETVISINNADTTLAFVTVVGILRGFSFDGSHALTFRNAAIETCTFGTKPPALHYEGVNASPDPACAFGPNGGLTPASLELTALGDFGGPTPVHHPRLASALIDAADNASCPAVDQRLWPRPEDGDGDGTAHCDIGAVELPEPRGALRAGAGLLSLLHAHRRRRRLQPSRDTGPRTGRGPQT